MASMARGQAKAGVRGRLVLMARPPFWVWPLLAGFVVTAVLASRFAYFPADLWTSHRVQDLEAAPYGGARGGATALHGPPCV